MIAGPLHKTGGELWGRHVYWLCDYSAVQEMLEYEVSISMVCHWEQELLGIVDSLSQLYRVKGVYFFLLIENDFVVGKLACKLY